MARFKKGNKPSEPLVVERSTKVSNQSFPLQDLPCELRNRIYDFHLEQVCTRSRVFGSGNRYWTHPDGFGPPVPAYTQTPGPERRGVFYEPVFLRWVDPSEHNDGYQNNWEFREFATPPVTLCGHNRVARESWDYYLSRLLVHVDAFNRFQAWCEEHLEKDHYVRMRRLYIITKGEYRLSDDSTPYIDEEHPTFLLELSGDRKAITVSSRFELPSSSLLLLQTNLTFLMEDRLEEKSVLDGRDIIEAMYAIHNYNSTPKTRSDMVVGPFGKGRVKWPFVLDDDAVSRVYTADRREVDIAKDAADRMQLFRFLCYRGEVGGGA